MKKTLVFIFTFYGIIQGTIATNLEDAVAKKMIQIIVSQANIQENSDFYLHVKNISGKAMSLQIPIGTQFQPTDTTLQPRFTTTKTEQLLAKNEIKTFYFQTVCTNAVKRSPLMGSIYQLRAKNNPKLVELSAFLNQQSTVFDHSDLQDAVWCITNQHRIESINNEVLKKKMSTITGQQIQPLKLKYKHENIPGQVAYRDKELRVEGLFRYGTDTDIKAQLGLYDKDGRLVKMLRPNMLHRRGQHSFRFDFVITNVRPGDFFIRLTTGQTTLNEMKITFS